MEKIFSQEVEDAFKAKRKQEFAKNVGEEKLNENKKLLFGDMPDADVRLYGIDSFAAGVYFASEEDLIHYINTYEIGIWSNLVVLEYFANFGNHQDVFRKTLNDGSTVFLSAYSTNEVWRLDIKASLENGHFIWEIIPGNLKKEYRVLKQMDIVLENDPYQVLDALNKHRKRELSIKK